MQIDDSKDTSRAAEVDDPVEPGKALLLPNPRLVVRFKVAIVDGNPNSVQAE